MSLLETMIFTVFALSALELKSIGYFTAQKYYCRPTCRTSRYFYSNRIAVAAQIPSSFLTSL